jgi:hypothetical protein
VSKAPFRLSCPPFKREIKGCHARHDIHVFTIHFFGAARQRVRIECLRLSEEIFVVISILIFWRAKQIYLLAPS